MGGRVFEGQRRVRLGDASASGRLRLDAVAAYCQDIANDDTRDSGYPDVMGWVVRHTTITVEVWPGLGEELVLTTFPSGTGPRWAERGTSIRGDRGGRVEVTSLWVHIDAQTLKPKRLPPEFFECFAISPDAPEVSARFLHASRPDGAPIQSRRWDIRSTDVDVLAHVNNAAYWAPIEDELDSVLESRPALSARLEYRMAIARSWPVSLTTHRLAPDRHDLWLHDGDRLFATAQVRAANTVER